MVLASLLAIYFALALLFWQGQWQLIFHPSHVVARTPASVGFSFKDVHFGATETGQPRLNGWWIPATVTDSRRLATVLYIHDARGSLSDALPDILALHQLGSNVFAFDPRGFGKSAWAKPSERHWNDDTYAALSYLSSVNHIPPHDVVLVGRGLGGTVAANLTAAHPELQRLIMIDPQPPTLALLTAPRWAHILPVRMLAGDRFDPGQALGSRTVRKVFLISPDRAVPSYVTGAAAPLMTVRSTGLDDPQSAAVLRQFLQQSPTSKND
jgi:pimeloyl-ACP methyl ester carboxylesterase